MLIVTIGQWPSWPPQPHARPFAIREFDAGGFEGSNLSLEPHAKASWTLIPRFEEHDIRPIKCRLDRLNRARARIGSAALNVLDADF